MKLFEELKRRNVFRVGMAYLVATWLLMQVADIVFPRIGLPDSAVTLVIALLAIGFIPALIIAWAFELTPEGIKREEQVDRASSITPKTGKRLDRMIIAGLAIIIIAMGAERIWLAGQNDPEKPTLADEPAAIATEKTSNSSPESPASTPQTHHSSVAVLPFEAMSSGVDDGYFADGLTEEILNSLAGLPELLVTARTSSFHFKGKNLPIPDIARTLGVENVVEGSVRRSGDQVRITAQLIRARDGFHLWSDTYDRTLEDVFAVQEDIAESIAETLDVVLNDDKREQMRRSGIGNVEAFIAYQKGVEVMMQAHSIADPLELLPEANRYFDQALAIVPSITDAQLKRTDLYGHIIYSNANGSQPFNQSELDTAMKELQAGLSQAARFAQTPAQRAYIEAERAEFSGDWSSLPAKFDRAFQSEECFAVNWVTSLSSAFGWVNETYTHYQRLMRCDPVSPVNVALGGQYGVWAGHADDVIEFSDQFLKTVESNPWVDDARFIAMLANGSYRDHLDAYGPTPEGSYYKIPRSILAHAMDNNIEKGRELLEASIVTTQVDDLTLLIFEAALGNREAANRYAAQMDARFAGPFMLAETIKMCFCGAPFDLEVTPNFKARIEEAGFHWPPPSPVQFPAKDW